MERKRRIKRPVSDDLTEKEIAGLEQQLGLSENQIVSREEAVQEQRGQFYTTFESRYQARIELVEMGKPGTEITQNLVYYRLNDLLAILFESGAIPSGILLRELRNRDIGSGEINRERVVSALETRGLAEGKDYVKTIVAYVQKSS